MVGTTVHEAYSERKMNLPINVNPYTSKIRPLSSIVLFLLIVSATFYPLASALFFGKTVNESLESRKVLGAHSNAPSYQDSGVFRNGVVSIAFDDGWESSYENGLPILNEHGYKASFYILSNFFDDMQYMSVAQVKSLQSQGHHIGSHTVSHPHLTELEQADMQLEVTGSQKQLEAKLGPIKDFASPYGDYDDDVLNEIKQHYNSHRTVAIGINTFENFNPYQLKSPNIQVNTPEDDIVALLKQAKENNGWLILTYHEINDSGREYSVTKEQFAKQMKLVEESGMKVALLPNVLEEIRRVYGTP